MKKTNEPFQDLMRILVSSLRSVQLRRDLRCLLLLRELADFASLSVTDLMHLIQSDPELAVGQGFLPFSTEHCRERLQESCSVGCPFPQGG